MNESEESDLILAKLAEIERRVDELRDMLDDEVNGILATIDRIEVSLQRTNELMRERLAQRKNP
ncbi:hypothetical protein QCE73_00060 [Caballeronia sp. LZ029]|uniref:hypothetical protein n=1 Tax=Caballeronia sp. LZ029 TaxID=3038564 RepID=UPI00285591B3|nr:hypothetical protein [Caballeronia sp. LZ029]MDR5741541.1 hypothetical protein [Caballeronia sp. LZ029]